MMTDASQFECERNSMRIPPKAKHLVSFLLSDCTRRPDHVRRLRPFLRRPRLDPRRAVRLVAPLLGCLPLR